MKALLFKRMAYLKWFPLRLSCVSDHSYNLANCLIILFKCLRFCKHQFIRSPFPGWKPLCFSKYPRPLSPICACAWATFWWHTQHPFEKVSNRSRCLSVFQSPRAVLCCPWNSTYDWARSHCVFKKPGSLPKKLLLMAALTHFWGSRHGVFDRVRGCLRQENPGPAFRNLQPH